MLEICCGDLVEVYAILNTISLFLYSEREVSETPVLPHSPRRLGQRIVVMENSEILKQM